MGCATSKADDLEAVKLCRERCHFLEEAIRQRYAFADSHVAYIQSLKQIGISLQLVFDQDLDNSTSLPSPLLPLPTQRKGDPIAVSSSEPPSSLPTGTAIARDSNSNSGSHIHFHSDSDDDDDDSGSLHFHSDHSSPLHHHSPPPPAYPPDYQLDQGPMASFPGGFMTMNYMRNRPAPSVSYEQRPMSPDIVRVEASSYYPSSYPNQDPASYPYNAYSNYGGFFGSTAAPYGGSSYPPPHMAAPPSSASSSKSPPPPPPPPPPRNSAWDFLNLFDPIERYDPLYTPSRDSKEVRDEEGIPDLEDENYQHEVVKEVHGDQKFVDGSGNGNYSKNVADDEDERGNHDGKAALYQTRPSVSVEGVEYDDHLVDKNVVANEERSEDQGNVPAFKARVRLRGALEVVAEIKIQFERAAEFASEVSMMLETGKLPYQRKNAVYQVSSKVLHVISPSISMASSQPSTSKSSEASSSTENSGSASVDFDEGAGTRSTTLSATLQKLYMWEKKLYDEVKAEEKMRVLHDRKRKRLQRLDEKGAEAHKVDSAQTIVRNLSTKIRIAIQFVDKISVKIAKLRDEELWPQINELIHGLVRMWKHMLECHQNQCQAITESKNLDALVSSRKFGTAHLGAAMRLEHEVLDWISNFSRWIGAQKGYIAALNGWLRKCIYDEPEETPDGIPPFSPGRMGAPPVFVICNQWSQAMDRISEKEVVDAMLAFAVALRHNIDLLQRMMTNGDVERKVKGLERDEQKMQKAFQALDKKIVMVSGQGTGALVPEQSDLSNISSLQSGLKQIFDAMERFTASSMQAYEELRVRIEEDRLARENAKVP